MKKAFKNIKNNMIFLFLFKKIHKKLKKIKKYFLIKDKDLI